MKNKETPKLVSYYVVLRKSENNTDELFHIFTRSVNPHLNRLKSRLASIERIDNIDWDIRKLTFQVNIDWDTSKLTSQLNIDWDIRKLTSQLKDTITILLDGTYHWSEIEQVDKLSSWFLLHFGEPISEYKNTQLVTSPTLNTFPYGLANTTITLSK